MKGRDKIEYFFFSFGEDTFATLAEFYPSIHSLGDLPSFLFTPLSLVQSAYEREREREREDHNLILKYVESEP